MTSFESKLQESVAIDISEKLVRAIFDIVELLINSEKLQNTQNRNFSKSSKSMIS